MNEKKSAIATIAILSAIILIFTAADFIQTDRFFSETENRVLASRPEFSLRELLITRGIMRHTSRTSL